MTKTSAEIDPVRLTAVREILGTETLRDTIDAAFRQVMRTHAVYGLFEPAREGGFAALLEPLTNRGLVSMCGVTELEALFSARNIDQRARMKRQLAESMDRVETPTDVGSCPPAACPRAHANG